MTKDEFLHRYVEKFSYDTFEITKTYDAKHFFMADSVLLKHQLQKVHSNLLQMFIPKLIFLVK